VSGCVRHKSGQSLAVPCDDFNNTYDPLGHSYLLAGPDGTPGAVVRHVVETMRTGRVAGALAEGRQLILGADFGRAPAAANSNLPEEAAAALPA
jgi:hypothetical protein